MTGMFVKLRKSFEKRINKIVENRKDSTRNKNKTIKYHYFSTNLIKVNDKT